MKGSLFRSGCIVLVIVSLMVVSGCGYGEYLRRGKGSGSNSTQTVTKYDAKDYDVLGVVRAEGHSRCILGYEYQSVIPPIFSEMKTTYVGTAVHEK